VDGLRRRLSWIACAWLCCQLSLTAAPLSLLTHAPEAADLVACTCAHTGHGECPMHHPKPQSQKRGCECRSGADPDAANIVSLIGPIAVLANVPSHLAPPPITQLPAYPITRFVDFVAPLDSPPPRA
jgi:hypothetical protein